MNSPAQAVVSIEPKSVCFSIEVVRLWGLVYRRNSMHQRTKLICGISVIALAAGSASATGVFVGHITVADSYGSTGGGEFRVQAGPDFTVTPLRTGTPFQGGVPAAPGLWEAFCVEKFEPLDFSLTYRADVNTTTTSSAAAYAGGAHGGFNDPLDPMTAYLYDHFINKTLTTPYDYVNEANRINDADAMQTAIWFIEQETSDPLTGKALAFFQEAQNAVNSGAWTGLGNVRILNLYTQVGSTARVDYQDLLIDTGVSSPIPLPSGAGLAGVGLLGVLTARRRRSR
jgi:hypothetical protein